MGDSGVTGPCFQRRVHQSEKLGTGAQFEVCSHRFGVRTSSRVGQPYCNNTKNHWKRYYEDSSIDAAVKRTKFSIPVAEAVTDGRTETLPIGLGSPKQLHGFQLEILALSHSALRTLSNYWHGFDPQPQGGNLRPILVVERGRCSFKDMFLESGSKQRMPTTIRAKLCYAGGIARTINNPRRYRGGQCSCISKRPKRDRMHFEASQLRAFGS